MLMSKEADRTVGKRGFCAAKASRLSVFTLLARQILACALCLFALTAPSTIAAQPAMASDLAREAQGTGRRPLVLFFTLAGCPFCERARREYLRPLAGSPNWQSKAVLREVPIEATLKGFDGRRLSGRELARSYAVTVYPTVVFVDATGKSVAPPLAGFAVPDFYGAMLEERLEIAGSHMPSP